MDFSIYAKEKFPDFYNLTKNSFNLTQNLLNFIEKKILILLEAEAFPCLE